MWDNILNKLFRIFVGKTTNENGEIFNDYKNNQARGQFSSAHGCSTQVNNLGEAAFGVYNISNPTSSFTIGGGKENERKNLFELTNDGKLYILGVGGYDGTNIESSLSLQEILDKKGEIDCKVENHTLIIYNEYANVQLEILKLVSDFIHF